MLGPFCVPGASETGADEAELTGALVVVAEAAGAVVAAAEVTAPGAALEVAEGATEAAPVGAAESTGAALDLARSASVGTAAGADEATGAGTGSAWKVEPGMERWKGGEKLVAWLESSTMRNPYCSPLVMVVESWSSFGGVQEYEPVLGMPAKRRN